jgi:hypothetical protein
MIKLELDHLGFCLIVILLLVILLLSGVFDLNLSVHAPEWKRSHHMGYGYNPYQLAFAPSYDSSPIDVWSYSEAGRGTVR